MTEKILCHICGVEASYFFGGSEALPVCLNWACEQALMAEINAALQVAAGEKQEQEELEVV